MENLPTKPLLRGGEGPLLPPNVRSRTEAQVPRQQQDRTGGMGDQHDAHPSR
jgi:hypothetical protein